MKRLTTILLLAAVGTSYAHNDAALEQRITELEKEIAQLKSDLGPVMEKANLEQQVAEQKNKARIRMRKDSEIYSRDELREIENLYQVANKKWKTEEGRESLELLISKYDKANRTGCAMLYLGQMSKGEDREKYLKTAIEDFSDCFYGNGVQVGAYARFYLAHHYKESGNSAKAEKLHDEIRKNYPNAIDHRAKPLSPQLD